MTKGKKILAQWSVLMSLMITLVSCDKGSERGPEIEGHPMSYWLSILNEDPGTSAKWHLARYGRYLSKGDPNLQKIIDGFKQALRRTDKSIESRTTLVWSIREMRSNAVDLVPDLLEMGPGAVGLNRDFLFMAGSQSYVGPHVELAQALVAVIAEIGPGAVPELIRTIENRETKWNVLRIAIPALGSIGPPAKDAVPALQRLVSQGSLHGRMAVYALGQIGPSAKEALPQLKKALKTEQDAAVIEEIKKAISLIGNP